MKDEAIEAPAPSAQAQGPPGAQGPGARTSRGRTPSLPPSPLDRRVRGLVSKYSSTAADLLYCTTRRELGDVLDEARAEEVWISAQQALRCLGHFLGRSGRIVLDLDAPAPILGPWRPDGSAPTAGRERMPAEPMGQGGPAAGPRSERRRQARAEAADAPAEILPSAAPLSMTEAPAATAVTANEAPALADEAPATTPATAPPSPAEELASAGAATPVAASPPSERSRVTPPTAAEPRAHIEPVADAEEAQRRHIDRLCADYEPVPPPLRPLACALPRDWRDDPSYVVNDPLLLGASAPVPQRGTIGRDFRDRFRVSLSLSEPFCLSAFSLPGGGKSYLLSNVLQMGVQPLRYLNELPRPACGIVFHGGGDAGYAPEALSCVEPNLNEAEVRRLMDDYGALPEGMRDVLLLCPLSRVEEMRARHPHCRVHPILFSLGELGMAGLRTLLGVRDGTQSLYVRVLGQILGRLGDEPSLERLAREVDAEPLMNQQQRRLVHARLQLLRPLIDDRWPLRRVLRPGRIVIVDVRDPWMAPGDVGLLSALLCAVLVQRPSSGEDFLRLVCFPEAHRHFATAELAGEIDRIGRQRRHLGAALLIESQDPLSVPRPLVALSDVLAIGKMADEAWVKHLCKANESLRGLRAQHTAPLDPGYLWLWAQRTCAGGDLSQKEHAGLHLVRVRPQVAQHGGGTRKVE